MGTPLYRILAGYNIASYKARKSSYQKGGGHVGEGTVGEKQDHTHDDHDGGNDGRPEFPICQKILHNTLFLGVEQISPLAAGPSRLGCSVSITIISRSPQTYKVQSGLIAMPVSKRTLHFHPSGQGLLNEGLFFGRVRTEDSPAVGSHDRSAETLTIGRTRDATHHRGLAADERPNIMRTRSYAPTSVCLICKNSIRHILFGVPDANQAQLFVVGRAEALRTSMSLSAQKAQSASDGAEREGTESPTWFVLRHWSPPDM